MRKLGIPTVLDRFIQQAVMQVLAKAMETRHSPTTAMDFDRIALAHQAVAQAQQYIAQG